MDDREAGSAADAEPAPDLSEVAAQCAAADLLDSTSSQSAIQSLSCFAAATNLLCGGDKSPQDRDIASAKEMAKEI